MSNIGRGLIITAVRTALYAFGTDFADYPGLIGYRFIKEEGLSFETSKARAEVTGFAWGNNEMVSTTDALETRSNNIFFSF